VRPYDSEAGRGGNEPAGARAMTAALNVPAQGTGIAAVNLPAHEACVLRTQYISPDAHRGLLPM